VELTEVIRIDRPIKQVVDAWVRLDCAAQYAPGVIERQVIGGGVIDKGTRVAAVDRWPGFDVTYRIELTAVEQPDRVAATLSEPLSGGWDAIFDDSDGPTELRLEITLSPTGALRLAMPLLRPWVRRRWHETVVGFGRWLEAGP
jgi:hypothetical protein